MRWNDLRAYVDQLERLGELEHVKGADWENEIGVISELMIERSGPAVLFEDNRFHEVILPRMNADSRG